MNVRIKFMYSKNPSQFSRKLLSGMKDDAKMKMKSSFGESFVFFFLEFSKIFTIFLMRHS